MGGESGDATKPGVTAFPVTGGLRAVTGFAFITVLPRAQLLAEAAGTASGWQGGCKWGESGDATGPIFIPHRRGAARHRERRHAGLPTASPTSGTASRIQNSDYRPTNQHPIIHLDRPALTPPVIRPVARRALASQSKA